MLPRSFADHHQRSTCTSGQTVRGFWHGCQLGAYQLLCLKSFVDFGHTVELFVYDRGISVPSWIERKDANEVLPAEHIMVYQREWWGKGSPSLHSNIFRYALLHKLGGWWIDLDVLLLRKDLPLGDDFYAKDYQNLVSTAALKLPCGHPLLADAIERSKRVSEPSAEWGQTGPNLMTKLVAEHGLTGRINPTHVLSPLDYHEIAAVFDPERNEQVRDRCREAAFIHLFNQLCSAAGVPRDAGPPVGSFIAQKFTEHDPGVKFTYRIQFADLSRWIQNFLGHQYYENLYRTMR